MSEWERRRCGDERGVGQAVAAIMHMHGGGARVVAEVGGAVPRVAWHGVGCASRTPSCARAGGAPRARARPEFRLEDAKQRAPGSRVRVWARCARWKGRPWARHEEGVTGVHRKPLRWSAFFAKNGFELWAPFWVKSQLKYGCSLGAVTQSQVQPQRVQHQHDHLDQQLSRPLQPPRFVPLQRRQGKNWYLLQSERSLDLTWLGLSLSIV